jgi:hypothetical protein
LQSKNEPLKLSRNDLLSRNELQSKNELKLRKSDLQSKTGLLRNSDLLSRNKLQSRNEPLKLRKSSLRMRTYMMSLIENKKDAELAEGSKLRGSNLHQP